MAYTSEEIYKFFTVDGDDKHYQKNCVNFHGKTAKNNGERYYIEIIAELLNDKKVDLDYYNESDELNNCFKFEKHNGALGESKTSEKALCRNWYKKGFPTLKNIEGEEIQLGEIIDYESNLLKSKKVNIDLTSVDGNTMYLIEVKGTKGKGEYYHTDETLLRAALEINTYYETLNKSGLLKEYKKELSSLNRSIKQEIEEVKKVIIFPENEKDFAYGTMIKNKKDFIEVYKYIQDKDNEIIVLTFDKNYQFKD